MCQTRRPSRISPSLWLLRGWIPPWQQELKSKYLISIESIAIFHCMFIERNLRRQGVFHSILIKYSTMVAVLGCGQSCLTMICSCNSLSVTSLGSEASGSGREGGRINADRHLPRYCICPRVDHPQEHPSQYHLHESHHLKPGDVA